MFSSMKKDLDLENKKYQYGWGCYADAEVAVGRVSLNASAKIFKESTPTTHRKQQSRSCCHNVGGYSFKLSNTNKIIFPLPSPPPMTQKNPMRCTNRLHNKSLDPLAKHVALHSATACAKGAQWDRWQLPRGYLNKGNFAKMILIALIFVLRIQSCSLPKKPKSGNCIIHAQTSLLSWDYLRLFPLHFSGKTSKKKVPLQWKALSVGIWEE